MRRSVRLASACAAALLGCAVVGAEAGAAGDVVAERSVDTGTAVGMPTAHFETFLDRLMWAESNGRDFAANPRSTAVGPFQFIRATFMDVARRHFAELSSFSDEEVLALRTDRAYARRAAAIYCMENLAYLTGKGLTPSFGHLRLSYLVGPMAAARLMQAHPQTPAVDILGASAIRANPFMVGLSASQLIARSARDVGEHHPAAVALAPEPRKRPAASAPAPHIAPRPAAPSFSVRCNQKLVACQRWIVMQTNKQRMAQQQASSRKATSRNGKRDNRPGV